MIAAMFDSRHIQVFHEVVRTGSYSAAARNLGYTQPAVSQQMRALERTAGTPLFTRAGRGLRLTEAGEVLARHAEGILADLSVAREQISAITGLRAGRIRICAFPSASATIVPEAAAYVTAHHPGLHIQLLEEEPPDSLEALRRGECDIALAFAYPGVEEELPDDFVEAPVLDDPVRLLLPSGHSLAGRDAIDLAELAGERWIAGCARCRGHFVGLCSSAGFEPEIAFTTDDNLAVQSLVAAGVGIALMPSLVLSSVRHPKVTGKAVR